MVRGKLKTYTISLFSEKSSYIKSSFVATGITNYEDYTSIPNLYIVPESSTFKHIFRFFPETNELVFVTETLMTAQIYIEKIHNILNQQYPGTELTVLHDFTIKT